MTPNEIMVAVNQLEDVAQARIAPHAFVVIGCWRDMWRVNFHCTPHRDFCAATPEEAIALAREFLSSCPTTESIAAVLGIDPALAAA